ncbi:P-loop containing nucleoside triphosphate hydrolase [Trinorchestia longiramus]|nr:P-loop containing nucleoside triphosphate hydrolase [Trinorchestia longiramus]
MFGMIVMAWTGGDLKKLEGLQNRKFRFTFQRLCLTNQSARMSTLSAHPNEINKVKVLVVGDSGVGKTSLVHLLVNGEVLTKSSWTIGCSVEVKIHEYREGSPGHRPYFVELWDIGGNSSHKSARHLFYTSVHGIILVHDLANRKSEQNLRQWLVEVLLKEKSNPGSRDALVDNFDADQFGALSKVYRTNKIPVLVVGTRLDNLAETRLTATLPRCTSVADTCSADELSVSCLDARSLAPGSGNAVKLSRFFDRVIDGQSCTGGRPGPYYGTYAGHGAKMRFA